jgi:alpha-amylase
MAPVNAPTTHAMQCRNTRTNAPLLIALAAGAVAALSASTANAQISDENPAPMLQWFETRWSDMARRMPDYFVAGWGKVWLPPVSRGYVWPGSANQNGDSAGYDPFDRFDLGKFGAQTAYGTEQYFGDVVTEFHRANAEVYIDMVLNHNAGRNGSAGFMTDGGYPGFWMNPPTPMRDKLAGDDWGDFNKGSGTSTYLQSTNPSSPNYCLLNGDLVSLIDINQASNNVYIRQPVVAGNPQNIPAGTYFNKPNANNARFYPDASLGTTTVNNPGMSFAGSLTTGIFTAPCDVPARNEPATQFTAGKFNLENPMAGDAVAENATGYMLRWVQWMVDVHKVDGFRIDAIKHTPSWFFDTYFDSVISSRRITPDGRSVTPYSFGECVEGNDFCFDRYVRKPNGRTTGRNAAGDAFGFRDALDLSGAGSIRDLINGFNSWSGVQGSHIDNTDDGFNNGSVGVNHIFSHDNGSNGNGTALPSIPTAQQQGWFAHAYLLMRPGQAKVYHHGRGLIRTGGFWPREGIPVALGWDPAANATNSVITNLVQLSNFFGRGWYYPKWTDNEVMIFERATAIASTTDGNCLVGCNRSYQSGVTNYDQRTFNTSFPQGTRLVEYTGNWNNPAYPAGTIPQYIDVGVNGSVTIRVPRNVSIGGTVHNKGFVVYAPAIPEGTLTLTNISKTIAPDPASAPDVRQRLTPLPVITAANFQVQLTTTRGESWGTSNANADDSALFRFNQGFVDFNGSGGADIPYTNTVVPGYEGFVTLRQPLFGTSNNTGQYAQTIDSSLLPEGINYLSVVAFRKRNANQAPLYREWRTPVYIDRLKPVATLTDPGQLALNATSAILSFSTRNDRTVNAIYAIANPPVGVDPVTLISGSNSAGRFDRFDWQGGITGLTNGLNTLAVVSCEESGNCGVQYFNIQVGPTACPCVADFDNSGGTPDAGDIDAFFAAWLAGNETADADCSGGTPDAGDIDEFFLQWLNGGC